MNHVRPDGVLIVGQWWDCRELFQEDFTKKTETILMAHKAGHFQRIRTFISIAEEVLGVATSEVGQTQRKTISYIIPSSFWTECPMRRSLFSILLRAGMSYDGDFDEALYGNLYASGTKPAIERFFAGCTTYNGRKTGWVNQFRDRSERQVQRLLS